MKQCLNAKHIYSPFLLSDYLLFSDSTSSLFFFSSWKLFSLKMDDFGFYGRNACLFLRYCALFSILCVCVSANGSFDRIQSLIHFVEFILSKFCISWTKAHTTTTTCCFYLFSEKHFDGMHSKSMSRCVNLSRYSAEISVALYKEPVFWQYKVNAWIGTTRRKWNGSGKCDIGQCVSVFWLHCSRNIIFQPETHCDLTSKMFVPYQLHVYSLNSFFIIPFLVAACVQFVSCVVWIGESF